MLLLFSAVSGLLTVFCQCCHDNAKTSIIKNVDLVLAEGTFAIQKTDSVKINGHGRFGNEYSGVYRPEHNLGEYDFGIFYGNLWLWILAPCVH